MKGYKTIVLNVAMLLVTVATVMNPDLVLDKVAIAESIDQVYLGIASLWTTAAVIVRSITIGPMFGGDS